MLYEYEQMGLNSICAMFYENIVSQNGNLQKECLWHDILPNSQAPVIFSRAPELLTGEEI